MTKEKLAAIAKNADTGEIETHEIVSCGGVKIPIFVDIFSQQIVESIRSGAYESHEAAEIRNLIQPGERILEVGAGCGFISTICALNENTTSVTAIEANPNLIPVIKKVHELNNVKVDLFNEILGPGDGKADLFLHKDYWASGTHEFLGMKIKINMTSFQSRLVQIKPTMLIVDIEGGEVSLFDQVDLRGVQKIMVEVHQNTIGRIGIKRLFDNLSKQNFHYDMYHSQHSVVTFSHVDRV